MGKLSDSYRENRALPSAAYARRDSPYPISDRQLGDFGEVTLPEKGPSR